MDRSGAGRVAAGQPFSGASPPALIVHLAAFRSRHAIIAATFARRIATTVSGAARRHKARLRAQAAASYRFGGSADAEPGAAPDRRGM